MRDIPIVGHGKPLLMQKIKSFLCTFSTKSCSFLAQKHLSTAVHALANRGRDLPLGWIPGPKHLMPLTSTLLLGST